MHCKIRLNKRVVWDLCPTWEGRMLSIYSNPLERAESRRLAASSAPWPSPAPPSWTILLICSRNQIRVTMLYILLAQTQNTEQEEINFAVTAGTLLQVFQLKLSEKKKKKKKRQK